MDERKRNGQSRRSRSSSDSRSHHGAQSNNGYRTAGGPDYRSTDWQSSEHPRGKRSIG